MSTAVVRPARAADVAELASIHLRSALTAYAHIFPAEAPKPTADGLAPHWAAAIANSSAPIRRRIGAEAVFVAEFEGRVVGGVIATTLTRPGVGNLRHLYVDPSVWGRGAGRALHDVAVTWCVESGIDPVELWVLEANVRARAMYERWGWQASDGERFINEGSGVREVRYRLDRVAAL